MTFKQILTHWPILTVVFASGGAFAWQEVQHRTLEQVVVKQAQISEKQEEASKAIILMELQTRIQGEAMVKLEDKIDKLIMLQTKGENL